MSFVKELQQKAEQLQDGIDGKDLELTLLQSEIQDVLSPSVLGTEITYTISEMLMELIAFEKSKGKSEKTAASKNRLLLLLDKTEQLNKLTTKLSLLKAVNREIHANYQLVRIENKTLKKQLKNIEMAENFGS